MVSDNLEQHPNWNSILQWSLRFQDNPSAERTLQPLEEERRQFLLAAFEEASSSAINPVSEMRKHLNVIRNPESNREDCVFALEELGFYAEDLDQANDLYLLGGLQVCCTYIRHSDPELQSLACEVIGTAVQNNEKITQFAAESFVLSQLLRMVDDVENSDLLRIKSLYAVSCLVRGNKDALDKFNTLEGYNMLIRALQSDVEKLQIKSLFLISNICTDFPEQSSDYYSMGIADQLYATCEKFSASEAISPGDSLLNHSLILLLLLHKHNHLAHFPASFIETLEKLNSKLSVESHPDQVQLCGELLETCSSNKSEIKTDVER